MSQFPGLGRQNIATLIAYVVLGIFSGMGLNRLNEFMDARVPGAYRSAWAAVPLKILPLALALVGAQIASASFASDWQSTTPGLAFVTFFFAMQTSLMEDIARLA